MPEILQYDFRVVGMGAVQRELRSVERAFVAHNARVARATGTRGGPYRSPAAQRSDALRGLDQIGRAARAADLKASRDRIRAESQATRAIERERLASIRRVQAAERRAAQATTRAREQFARRTVGVAGRSVGGSVRAVGGLAAMGLGIGGSIAVAGAIQKEKEARKIASQLANQAFKEGGPSREVLASQFMATARRAGAGGEGTANVLQGIARFQALTGEAEIGQGITPRAVDIATATGADIADVFSVAGEAMLIMQQRGIRGADALKKIDDILLSLAAQGKMGSIEFADLATSMSKLGASTDKFEGDVVDLVTTMGAMAQIGKRGGAQNVEEATTSLMRLRDDLVQNAKRFKAVGVDVFTRDEQGIKTGIRHPLEVLAETAKATKGDIGKTSALLGIRGAKVADPFFGMARTLGKGDTAKGIDLALAEFNAFRKAKMSEAELTESAAYRRRQADMQFDAAMEKFNVAIGSEMLPAVTKLIPKFVELLPSLTKAAEMFAKFVDELAEKPVATIGKIIAAKLVLDLAMAGIGGAAKGAIVKAIAGAGTVTPGVGGTGGAAGLGAGAAPAVAAVAVGTGLAMDQASKLQKLTGSNTSLMDLLPGFKGGSFSSDQLIAEMNPLESIEKGTGVVSGFMLDTLRAGGVGPQELKRGVGGTGRIAGDLALDKAGMLAQISPGAPKLPDDWSSVPKQISAATAKLGTAADKLGASGPNRSDKPSSPIK